MLLEYILVNPNRTNRRILPPLILAWSINILTAGYSPAQEQRYSPHTPPTLQTQAPDYKVETSSPHHLNDTMQTPSPYNNSYNLDSKTQQNSCETPPIPYDLMVSPFTHLFDTDPRNLKVISLWHDRRSDKIYRKNRKGKRKVIGKTNRLHQGIDIEAPRGTKLLADREGIAYHISNNKGGLCVLLIDPKTGTFSYYAHCKKWLIPDGKHVLPGEYVAVIGKTGNAESIHLHFQIGQLTEGWNGTKHAAKLNIDPYLVESVYQDHEK